MPGQPASVETAPIPAGAPKRRTLDNAVSPGLDLAESVVCVARIPHE